MDGGVSRLETLQAAAGEFIDAITDRGTNALTTVNLLRYAGQVNPGPTVFDLLSGQRSHDASSCSSWRKPLSPIPPCPAAAMVPRGASGHDFIVVKSAFVDQPD